MSVRETIVGSTRPLEMVPELLDAVDRGDAARVAALLRRPEIDPAAEDNKAIRLAALKGHTEVVALLLADPRVDPAAEDDAALRAATERGHAEVVALLLLVDPQFGPEALAGEGFAAFCRRYPVAAFLAARRR